MRWIFHKEKKREREELTIENYKEKSVVIGINPCAILLSAKLVKSMRETDEELFN
ncbi:MAG: hypothetical protein RBR14_00175 [Candidatus Cloacimonas acidaminovorans]|nr:hypothetical protein [Candidatus Cloacimonas acidaminovorans]